MRNRTSIETSTKAPGEIVTFYSYKGGTGRTMSLVNLGCLMADRLKQGERILLIDWDLEAPGLHRYFHSRLKPTVQNGEFSAGSSDDLPGLIDLFEQLSKAGEQPEIRRKRNPETRAKALLDSMTLDDFILPTNIPNLDIVKAGRLDAGYGTRVNAFPWEGFYTRYPLAFRELAKRLKEKYRYVFIDSRTGQTDTAGICTTLMPEKLVLVFTPNRQSLYGIEAILKDAVAYRRRDRDLRPLVAYPLPARVHVSLDELRIQWRFGDRQKNVEGYEPFLTRSMREAYGLRHCHLKRYFDEVQIKHSAHYSFGEEIAVLNERSQRIEDEYSLTRAYQNLLNWLAPGFLPWESPEAIHLMRSIENRAQVVPLETQALAEDLKSLRELAGRLDDMGDIGNAELAIRTGERFARRHLGETHVESLAYANKATGILLSNGKLDAAHTQAKRTLMLCREHLGEEHAETLSAQGNLASTLHAQGDLVAALALEKSVLAARRRILGEEHPDTLTAMNNLASTLHAQGNLAGALELEKSALAIRRRVLGEEHPDTLSAMSNLAGTLHAQGDLAGALELQKSVLAIRRRVLGEEHPDTLTAMNNLASTLHAQDDLAGALELQKLTLAIQQRVLGEEHPNTLTTMNNLVNTLRAMSRPEVAEALHNEMGAVRRRQTERAKVRRNAGTPVRVMGIGGAGGNALQALTRLELHEVGLIALDTDHAKLDRLSVQIHLPLGNGRGMGGRPDMAKAAALQRKSAIQEALEGTQLLIVVAGLGGGTGTSVSPVVVDIAREMGIVTVAIVTAPFAFEGRRAQLADAAEAQLLRKADALIVIRNDDLMEKLGEDATMQDAFASVDEEVAGVVQGMVDIVTTPGLVNIDLEDLRSIFTQKGRAAAATGLAEGPERAAAAVISAIEVIENKQGFRLSAAAGVLVNITASSSLSLKEYKRVMATLRPHISPSATLICGAVFDEKLQSKLRTTIIAAGIAFPHMAVSGSSEARSHLADLPAFLRKQGD